MISVPKNAASVSKKQIIPVLTGFGRDGSSSRPAASPAPSSSYFQSGSSGCLRSQSGRRLRTVGVVSKLYDGGGEVVAHSSVHASHGSSPAGAPFFRDMSRFQTKIR